MRSINPYFEELKQMYNGAEVSLSRLGLGTIGNSRDQLPETQYAGHIEGCVGLCGVTERSLDGKYGETGYLVRLNTVNRMRC